MNRRRIVAIALMMSWAPLAGCHRAAKEAVKSGPPTFRVARAVADEVVNYEEFPGHLDAFKSVEVRAQVGGYLIAAPFSEGGEVAEGDELFRIDPRPYEAEVERAEATVRRYESRLVRVDADTKRAANLFNRGTINRQEADRSTGDYAETKAALGTAQAALIRAKINLDFTSVRAPFAGQISQRRVDPGTLVRAGVTPLTTLLALDPIYVYLTVDEQTLGRLRGVAMSVGDGEHELTALAGLADEIGEYPYPVSITFSDNQINAASGTLLIRGAIANPVRPDGNRLFVPGMYARVRVPVGTPRRALLVPERALGTDQGRKFLYVVDDKQKVVYRPVKIGPAHKGMRVIEEGLKPGELFVAGDISRIMADMMITPVEVAAPMTLAGSESSPGSSVAPAPSAVPTRPGPSRDEPDPPARSTGTRPSPRRRDRLHLGTGPGRPPGDRRVGPGVGLSEPPARQRPRDAGGSFKRDATRPTS